MQAFRYIEDDYCWLSHPSHADDGWLTGARLFGLDGRVSCLYYGGLYVLEET